jgi:hypothetical protein
MTKLWRVISSTSLLGQHYQNVWHFTSEDSAVDELTVKNEVTPGMITRLRNHQNVNLIYETMSVQQLLPTLQPAEVFSMAGAHGSLDGLPYHPSICVLFSIRTPFGGRTGHGRWYMPGLHFDHVENGVLRADIWSLFQGDASYITNSYKSGTTLSLVTMVVVTRSNPGAYRPMTTIVARQTLGIQRRRNIGVGG